MLKQVQVSKHLLVTTFWHAHIWAHPSKSREAQNWLLWIIFELKKESKYGDFELDKDFNSPDFESDTDFKQLSNILLIT